MPSHRSGQVVPGRVPGEANNRGTVVRLFTSPAPPGEAPMTLHVSKLRGISLPVRNKLKRVGISYTHQLLQRAGGGEGRRQLAHDARIDEADLVRLVRRADLARIKGVGAIFADMLERVGIDQVAQLAAETPLELHRRLQALNAAERMARRSPTPDEVEEWVAQARALPHMVDSD